MRGTAKQTASRRRPLEVPFGSRSHLGGAREGEEEAEAEKEEKERQKEEAVEEEKKKLLGEGSRARNFSVGFIRASF